MKNIAHYVSQKWKRQNTKRQNLTKDKIEMCKFYLIGFAENIIDDMRETILANIMDENVTELKNKNT